MKNQKSVTIAIVGRANTGKSTMFNLLLNSPLSPVTHKRQTTQTILNGIITENNIQIVLWDTPGIFKQEANASDRFVKSSWQAIQSADLVFIMISSVFKHDLQTEKYILQNLNYDKNKIVICINKKDLTPNRIDELNMIFKDYNTITTCALKSKYKEKIINIFKSKAKTKEWLYSKEQKTSLSKVEISNEITKKHILLNIHQEIPYQIQVENNEIIEENKNIKISQTIITSKKSHKGIIIGKNAKQLIHINKQSRREMENIFNKKIHLMINVK